MTSDQTLKNGIAGGSAGAISKFIMYPLERYKVYVQTQILQPKSWNVIQKIYTIEGLRGFYKGLGINITRTSYMQSIRFLCFDDLRASYGLIVGSLMSSIMQTIFTHPLENIKTRMLKDIGGLGVWDTLKKVNIEEGLTRGLYKGVTSSGVIGCLFVVTDFGIYNTIKDKYQVYHTPFFSGCLSGTIAHSVIYPIDTYMRQTINGISSYTIKSLYRGFFINIIRVIPTGGIHYYLYEKLRFFRS